ncbi:hypothetical protein QBC46DRAFT_318189 [Diplogelasinospora grovesii]|uniref:NmrA-like domain-containing protein n=1 Tax=Diplogelasinospora grovesii TaxID=303347 RepID=A0AAN6S317_9PEZI|nr:hypothetical protein QBC46DRAFT_318189 [Diplogelasinospora grovesii]
MAIKNVAVVGASGNVGAPLVKALLAANFHVTAISREESTSTFPEGVSVLKADLGSVDSLTKAFAGQDAVVSTIAIPALGSQEALVDAAVAAGVRRFLPSEFGHHTLKLATQKGEMLAQLLGSKTQLLEHIIEKSKSNPEFTWTGLATSPFTDWGLDHGFWKINLKDKTAEIVDSGDEPASTSSLGFVAQAVVAVLQHEQETANKFLDVVEFTLSQNQLLKIFEEETGEKFTVTHTTTADVLKDGHEKLAKGDFSAFVNFLWAYSFRDGSDHAVKEEDKANTLLGLKSGDIRQLVKDYIKNKQ